MYLGKGNDTSIKQNSIFINQRYFKQFNLIEIGPVIVEKMKL